MLMRRFEPCQKLLESYEISPNEKNPDALLSKIFKGLQEKLKYLTDRR